MSSRYANDDISVVLLDKEGFTISAIEMCETIKEAKDRAKYLISDAYAKSAETTHEAWNTEKVEVRVNGDCLYDFFR